MQDKVENIMKSALCPEHREGKTRTLIEEALTSLYKQGQEDKEIEITEMLKKEKRKCTIAIRGMEEYDRYNRTQIFKGQSVKKNFAEKLLRQIRNKKL